MRAKPDKLSMKATRFIEVSKSGVQVWTHPFPFKKSPLSNIYNSHKHNNLLHYTSLLVKRYILQEYPVYYKTISRLARVQDRFLENWLILGIFLFDKHHRMPLKRRRGP